MFVCVCVCMNVCVCMGVFAVTPSSCSNVIHALYPSLATIIKKINKRYCRFTLFMELLVFLLNKSYKILVQE